MSSSRHTARRSLRTFLALLEKELVQLYRDRAIFFFICYIFTLDIVIHAAGSSVELRRETVFVRDFDNSALSRELVARLRPPYFRTQGAGADPGNDERALERGEARLVLEFPRGFAEQVTAAREPAQIQAVVDSSKVLSGYLASGYAARITETLNEELAVERLSRLGLDPRSLPRVENEVRLAYNFAGDDRWTTALSMLFTMMTFACVLLPAAAMVREKEHGTLEQLLVSPLTPFEILAPKVLSMVLVSVVGTTISVLGVLGPVLGVPCRGSLSLFLMLTAVYAFTNAGLGVLVGVFARTTAQSAWPCS
jgi:ABC-2 type transport system permease protein